MTTKEKNLNEQLSHLILQHHKHSVGMYLTDHSDYILSREKMQEIAKSILTFTSTFTQGSIDTHNEELSKKYEEEMYPYSVENTPKYYICQFKKHRHINHGTVYIYRDIASGKTQHHRNTESRSKYKRFLSSHN